MKIILLATWPNGQTQHIYSTTSRLIAKSEFNQKLNKHIIPITGNDAKFIAECVWNARSVTPAVPMVVDENYDPIPLGSEFGPNLVPLNPPTNEPNQKAAIPPVEEIRQELPESRELPVVQGQSPTPKPEAATETDDLTISEDTDPESDMPLEEIICKRIAQYGKLKVKTLAANLGVDEDEVIRCVKQSDYLKITGSKKVATVSSK